MVSFKEMDKELKDKVGIELILLQKGESYTFNQDTYLIYAREAYEKLYLPSKTHIEKQKQLSDKNVQLQDKLVQLQDKLVQIQDNSDNLQKDLDRSRQDMDLVKGKLTKMPKHVSLIHKHIKASPDGLTCTELAREIKKSRSSVYRTLNYLVHREYIVKRGSIFIDASSEYYY